VHCLFLSYLGSERLQIIIKPEWDIALPVHIKVNCRFYGSDRLELLCSVEFIVSRCLEIKINVSVEISNGHKTWNNVVSREMTCYLR
jgi:hypothetical protein